MAPTYLFNDWVSLFHLPGALLLLLNKEERRKEEQAKLPSGVSYFRLSLTPPSITL